jgi:hypothetical protein
MALGRKAGALGRKPLPEDQKRIYERITVAPARHARIVERIEQARWINFTAFFDEAAELLLEVDMDEQAARAAAKARITRRRVEA